MHSFIIRNHVYLDLLNMYAFRFSKKDWTFISLKQGRNHCGYNCGINEASLLVYYVILYLFLSLHCDLTEN